MNASSFVQKWPRTIRIIYKLFVQVVVLLGLYCIPLLFKDTIMNRFSSLSADSTTTAEAAGGTVYSTVFFGFIVILGVIFLLNLLFFIIDEEKQDSVVSRRIWQIILNILFIILGGGAMLYLSNLYLPNLPWWASLYISEPTRKFFNWGPAAIIMFCSMILMTIQVFGFCGENRNPWYLHSASKQVNARIERGTNS